MKIILATLLALSVLAGATAPASAGQRFNATKFYADLDRWGGGTSN